MGSIFGESAAPYYATEEQEEEEPLDPLANTGDIPYAQGYVPPTPPTGSVAGYWAGAPPLNPPAGEVSGNYIGQGFQMEPAPSGEVAGYWTGSGFGMEPPSSPTGGINPNQGGFRGPENPANIEPGPNADFGIFDLGQARENTYVPVLTPFIEDYAQPALGAAINAQNPFSGYTNDLLGVDTGQIGAEAILPSRGIDLAFNLATGGGLSGFDDLARMGGTALGGVDNAIRFASPEPQLFPGLGSGPAPNQWDESVLGPLPSGLDNYQRAQPVLDPLAPIDQQRAILNADPETARAAGFLPPEAPAFPQRYPSIPEGTMGSEFPEVVGDPRWYHNPNAAGNYIPEQGWRSTPVAPDAPASAMGAPLAYDPQFATPPPADAAMRDLGVSPVADDTAQQMRDAFAGARREESILTGGGSAVPAPSVPEVRAPDWLKTAPDVVTPPTSMYHGTGSRFDTFGDDMMDQTALYGPGVYLTDSQKIADSYATNRSRKTGEEAITQGVTVRPDAQLINLEQPLPQAAKDAILRNAEYALEHGTWDVEAWDNAARAVNSGEPGKGVYSAFKNGLADEMTSVSDAGEAMDGLNQALRGAGYDGLAHVGGIRGGESHNVTILFTADDVRGMNPVSRLTGGGSTPNPPSAELGLGSPPPASTVEIPTNPQPTAFDAEALRRGDNGAGTRTDEILGSASPTAVQREAASIAPNIGVTPDRANELLKNWEFNAQITQDYVNNPTGLARLASVAERPVEGGITGNFSDSFVTGLMQRRSDLEQTLQRGTNWTPQQIKTAVDSAVEQRLQRHYANNPTGLTSTKQTLTEAEAKATELAKDFKGLNTFVERTKNTMFPLDFGFLGQNILTGMRQGGVTTLIGMANRVAQAVNLPFAVDLEKATGLPRMLAASNDGLRLGNVASGLKPDEGTLLRYIPGLSPIDKHAITPLIGKLTDAQYTGLGGFLKMMNYEGNLAVLGAAGKDIADPAVRRDAARITNNAWSSASTATTPGRAQAEKLSFTSPAFTRSQVGVLTDMAKLITPGASETQRILAATAILSNAVMIAAIYKTLNDQFGVGDAQLDPTKPGFGNIILDSKNSDGKNQVVNMFPQRSFQTAITRAVDAVKDKDPEALAEAIAKLGAGRAGALPSGAARGAGFGYDTQGQFHMGGMPWQERIKASIPAPVSLQNTFTGGATDPTTMALELGGVPNYPESTGSQMYREGQDVNAIRSGITLDSGVLSAAFPNNPELANAVRGQDWNALTTEERKALIDADRSLNPGHAKALDALDETRKQYNEEKPTAISNRIRIQQETDERISGIRKEYGAEFDKIGEKMINGSGDPRVLRQTMTALREQQNQDISVERWKGGTTYAGLPEREGKDGSGRLPNEVQEAISAYFDIGDKIPRVEGKPNFDAIQGAREGFVIDLYRSSPDTANRLDFYLQQRSIEAEAQKSEFMRFWDDTVIPALNRYYDQPEGGRTAWRREHAMDDALLTFGGYMPSTVSPMAGELLKGLAPGRGVK